MSYAEAPRAVATRARHSRRSAATILAAALLGSTAIAGDAAAAELAAAARIDKPVALAETAQPIYVLISLKAPAPDAETLTNRPAAAIGLVLDRSGSMEDAGKITYLRRAATMAVDAIGPRDSMAVVEYDDTITLLQPLSSDFDAAALKRRIEALDPRGSTNLAGGLERGIAELRGADANTPVRRVILMSDGLANQGETDPRAIAAMAAEARRAGIRVSAIGLGAEYDEDLMQAIAERGGGRYWFVESPGQMARIFSEEINAAFGTWAKDVTIRFTGSAAVSKAEIVGYADGAGNVSATVEDLVAGESRTALVRLELADGAEGVRDLGDLDVSWTPAAGGDVRRWTQDVTVTFTADAAAADAALDTGVAAEAALAEADRVQAAALKDYEDGRPDDARAKMDALSAQLTQQNTRLNDQRVAKRVEGLVLESQAVMAAPAAAQEDYLKASKQRLYQAKGGNRTGVMLDEGASGVQVENLQRALKDAGLYAGPADGQYTAELKAAVAAYQSREGLEADGVAGPATLSRLGLY